MSSSKKAGSGAGFNKSDLTQQRNDCGSQIQTLNTYLIDNAQNTSVSDTEVRLIRDQILYLEMVQSILDKRLSLLNDKPKRKTT